MHNPAAQTGFGIASTLYGTGVISDFVHVLNPFAANPALNLISRLGKLLFGLRELKQQFPNDFAFPIYYEPGGLLPWGKSIDGDLYCWSTQGPSGVWATTVVPRHAPVEHFPLTMSQYLKSVLTGEIQSYGFPELEGGERPNFVPLGEA